MKKANGDVLWAEAGDPLLTTFNQFSGGIFGANFQAPQNSFYFTIGIEFTVMPPGIAEQPGVKFDITRNIAFKDWQINGNDVQPVPHATKDDSFDPGDLSDDDTPPPNDEDVVPVVSQTTGDGLGNKIYVIDSVGDGLFASSEQYISRNNFEECVRVSFDGQRRDGNNDNGSRCSENLPWHAFYWVKRDPTGNYQMKAGKTNVLDEGHLPLSTAPIP